MLTSDQLYAVAGCATVAGGAVGWLAGHLRTTRRYERDGGLMDQTYDEGVDSAISVLLPAVRHVPGPDAGPEHAAVTDFLHPDFEQLDPARLDAANQDLPGPEESPRPMTVGNVALGLVGNPEGRRAGEHHMDAPLPTVLSLGTEYDGGPQTAARVAWRLWDMTARYELERDRFRAECGLGTAA